MEKIQVIKNPTEEQLNKLGIKSWGIWTKEESEFPWSYDEKETCFLLEGDVDVTTEDGKSVHFEAGNLVVFPKGLKNVTWKVNKAVKKHYKFGD
ncbi:MAG: cupin domain-containing protein [Promethearchaeota archaeon]